MPFFAKKTKTGGNYLIHSNIYIRLSYLSENTPFFAKPIKNIKHTSFFSFIIQQVRAKLPVPHYK